MSTYSISPPLPPHSALNRHRFSEAGKIRESRRWFGHSLSQTSPRVPFWLRQTRNVMHPSFSPSSPARYLYETMLDRTPCNRSKGCRTGARYFVYKKPKRPNCNQPSLEGFALQPQTPGIRYAVTVKKRSAYHCPKSTSQPCNRHNRRSTVARNFV